MPVSDAEAGAREPFEDAALYDHEYRRRRADVSFYRRLAADRMSGAAAGPVLDLACGTGRVLVPLLRDGHSVLGLDRSAAMLERAARRVGRLTAARRKRCLLVRADMRALGIRHGFPGQGFALALCAFHSVQHLPTAADLERFLLAVRATLADDGWLAFDVLPPDPAWLGRDPARRWARTAFRHPTTGQRLVYTTNHLYDPSRRLLHMKLYYQPVDRFGRAVADERVVRLCHRQLAPAEVQRLLETTGFRLLATFGGFDGRPLPPGAGLPADEHIYVARAL